MRIRYNKNAEAAVRKRPDIVITTPEEYKSKWKAEFHRKNGMDLPLYVELGMGKGHYITEMAMAHPETNFIGIDMHNELLYAALRKTVVKGLDKNLLLVLANIEGIETIFEEHEVDLFYINFCDPWPKSRHAKRRLTHRTFLNKYKSMLAPHGEIIFKTDNMGLFDFSLPEFEAAGFELTEVTRDLHSLNDPSNIMTEYEKKFSDMGQPIYRAKAKIK